LVYWPTYGDDVNSWHLVKFDDLRWWPPCLYRIPLHDYGVRFQAHRYLFSDFLTTIFHPDSSLFCIDFLLGSRLNLPCLILPVVLEFWSGRAYLLSRRRAPSCLSWLSALILIPSLLCKRTQFISCCLLCMLLAAPPILYSMIYKETNIYVSFL
jgi:hypothetical protein